MVKSTPRVGTRSSVQMQHIQLSPTSHAPISQSTGIKWKRPQSSEAEAEFDGLEGVGPSKQLRELSPSGHKLLRDKVEDEQEHHPAGHALSEKNLQILRILNGEDIDPAANNTPALKRTLSRRSIAASDTGTERTQCSSNTATVYWHKNLAAVEIHMHTEPPDYIQTAIDRIIKAEVSKERRSELRSIAQELRSGCLKNVRAQAGEDDFIDPLHTVLKALGLKNLCTHEKADWRGELKPVAPHQSHFSSNFMSSVQQLEVDDVSASPRKRQQQAADTDTSPPESLIKTPRPDISIGIQHMALISALSSQNLNKVQARKFLEWLQNELYPRPTPHALDLAFRFAVVEGKAYSTGKQIFEPENQASVSGACGLKIQLDLDNLVNRGATGSVTLPTTSDTEPPLFFTICTQGPIHELWAHWTAVEDGVRMFGSKLLDSCNALLLEQGEGFMVGLNNISLWDLGPFMESVVAGKAKVE